MRYRRIAARDRRERVTKRPAEMSNALTVLSNHQNAEIKKISAWAAILFAPTLVGTVHGVPCRRSLPPFKRRKWI
jgi:Mg2+ and Co2+ transporter CorA